jgi:hypothetical protein
MAKSVVDEETEAESHRSGHCGLLRFSSQKVEQIMPEADAAPTATPDLLLL